MSDWRTPLADRLDRLPATAEWVRNGIVVAASDRVDPELPVDEAWGINGCAAVLSAILAAMGSLAS